MSINNLVAGWILFILFEVFIVTGLRQNYIDEMERVRRHTCNKEALKEESKQTFICCVIGFVLLNILAYGVYFCIINMEAGLTNTCIYYREGGIFDEIFK